MALTGVISEIERDVGRKSQFFYTVPPCIRRPRGHRLSIAIPFGTKKLEWWGYLIVIFRIAYANVVDRILACDRRTDRRRNILRRHSPRGVNPMVDCILLPQRPFATNYDEPTSLVSHGEVLTHHIQEMVWILWSTGGSIRVDTICSWVVHRTCHPRRSL